MKLAELQIISNLLLVTQFPNPVRTPKKEKSTAFVSHAAPFPPRTRRSRTLGPRRRRAPASLPPTSPPPPPPPRDSVSASTRSHPASPCPHAPPWRCHGRRPLAAMEPPLAQLSPKIESPHSHVLPSVSIACQIGPMENPQIGLSPSPTQAGKASSSGSRRGKPTGGGRIISVWRPTFGVCFMLVLTSSQSDSLM